MSPFKICKIVELISPGRYPIYISLLGFLSLFRNLLRNFQQLVIVQHRRQLCSRILVSFFRVTIHTAGGEKGWKESAEQREGERNDADEGGGGEGESR